MAFVGWALILFGLVFLALGAAAAAKEVSRSKSAENLDTSLLRDLTEFLKTLATLPRSAMFVVLGAALVAAGALLVSDPTLSFAKPNDVIPAAAPARPGN